MGCPASSFVFIVLTLIRVEVNKYNAPLMLADLTHLNYPKSPQLQQALFAVSTFHVRSSLVSRCPCIMHPHVNLVRLCDPSQQDAGRGTGILPEGVGYKKDMIAWIVHNVNLLSIRSGDHFSHQHHPPAPGDIPAEEWYCTALESIRPIKNKISTITKMKCL